MIYNVTVADIRIELQKRGECLMGASDYWQTDESYPFFESLNDDNDTIGFLNQKAPKTDNDNDSTSKKKKKKKRRKQCDDENCQLV